MACSTGDGRPKDNDRTQEKPYDGVDEPAKLVENESVEGERETPTDDNEPVEQVKGNNKSDAPAFEE